MAEERKADIPFDAEWPHDLQHRPDPNRVSNLQLPLDGRRDSRTPQGRSVPSDRGVALSRPRSSFSQDPNPEPSYYDVSPLKSPLWRWEIAWYFYLGGMSAGAYILSRMAERHGRGKYDDITRIGAYAALAAFLPCPPLLIADLGDPKRFHHMLRVFKPSSPMSLGTWSIMGYSGMAALEAVRQYLRDPAASADEKGILSRMTGNKTLLLLHDAAGVPFAMLVAGYTGVLLSATANPLWGRSKWLGPLFTASAISTGASAINLLLPARAKRQSHALEKVDTLAHAVEGVCVAGFLKERGELAKPLTHGNQRHVFRLTSLGLIASEALKFLPLPGKLKRFAGKLSSVLALLSGFGLRWTMVYGGRDAAKDAYLSRLSSKPGTGLASR